MGEREIEGCGRAGRRFQVSAQPPAKKTAGLIEKETLPWASFIQGFKSQYISRANNVMKDWKKGDGEKGWNEMYEAQNCGYELMLFCST